MCYCNKVNSYNIEWEIFRVVVCFEEVVGEQKCIALPCSCIIMHDCIYLIFNDGQSFTWVYFHALTIYIAYACIWLVSELAFQQLVPEGHEENDHMHAHVYCIYTHMYSICTV